MWWSTWMPIQVNTRTLRARVLESGECGSTQVGAGEGSVQMLIGINKIKVQMSSILAAMIVLYNV